MGKVAIVLVLVGVGLVACEATLRLWQHPRYASATEMSRDGLPNTYWRGMNPLTHAEHHVIRNNLGGRQSRDFRGADLGPAINIAFFGDGQTENHLLPAQYAFTDPLDHLLNAHPAAMDEGSPSRPARLRAAPAEGSLLARGTPSRTPAEGSRFNVLNFGVTGWGPGRSYLLWRYLPVRRKLAHVFYVAWQDDVDDLRSAIRDGVVRLGAAGNVVDTVHGHARGRLKRLLSRLHLPHLAIDAWHMVARTSAVPAKFSRNQALAVSRETLLRWKRQVEADGGMFHVVLLPHRSASSWLRTLANKELRILDLVECFETARPGFHYRDLRFANDVYWTPAANMVAATCLYRYLEEDFLGLPRLAEEDVATALRGYYHAFLASRAWEGERYAPTPAKTQPAAGSRPSVPNGGKIVAKYLALELALAGDEQSSDAVETEPRDEQWVDAVRTAREAGPIATGVWAVYANTRERLLVYAKSPCPEHLSVPATGEFFVHVLPFLSDKVASVATDEAAGFVNLDQNAREYLHRSEEECVFSMQLPDYRLSWVRTGQMRVQRVGGKTVYKETWSVRFPMPFARSVWDVRASADGRGLEYVKKPCSVADTEDRFYLHVHPLSLADLPPALATRGYVNLDFDWREAGVMAKGACTVSATLPDFPVAYLRTGQFRGTVIPKRLWSARIDFAEEERRKTRQDGDSA